MKTHLLPRLALALTFAVAPILAPNVQAQSVPDNRLIVPGERIGRVFLGDSRTTVRRRLGPPARTFTLSPGVTSEVWRGSRRPDTDGYYTLEVVYRRGVVRQIESTNPIFKTRSGLDAGTTMEAWTEILSEPTTRQYSYRTGANSLKTYHSWNAGITMELVGDREEQAPETVIVHPRGTRVIADRGGVLLRRD